ncbi:MAG: hypothetical protein M5U15_03240 [Kiritimatiellae bacterium]|nr:hypothetical protein [Kiritimatiellia bacterium]
MSRRRFRAKLELRLARLALATLPRLSRPTLCRLSVVLGSLAFYFGGGRTRRVAEANLDLVFPDKSRAEKKRILKTSLQSFALAMLDVFWLTKDPNARLGEIVELDPRSNPLVQPGPMVCVTAHLGNWEIFGMAVSRQSGEPLTSVAATLKNHRVDELFNSLREATGQHVVARKGAARPLMKALRENRKIALVLDQNTKPIEGGVFVDFLGRPAPISGAAALLALRTGAPLIVDVLLPIAGGRYRSRETVFIDKTGLPSDHDAAILVLTQRIADVLSEIIRRHPEYWVWSYKRWKIRPPDAKAEDYPYYSRPLNPTDLPVTERG